MSQYLRSEWDEQLNQGRRFLARVRRMETEAQKIRREELADPKSDYWQKGWGQFAKAAKVDKNHLVQINTEPRPYDWPPLAAAV